MQEYYKPSCEGEDANVEDVCERFMIRIPAKTSKKKRCETRERWNGKETKMLQTTNSHKRRTENGKNPQGEKY